MTAADLRRRRAGGRAAPEVAVEAASVSSPASRLALAAILLTTTLLRLRLLHVPLERDEGEYAYMGQLILRGQTPYLAAHNMKLPGVYYAYAAVLAAFGETDVGVRLGLLLVNLVAIALVYQMGRRLMDATAGVIAAAVYAALSVGESVAGFSAKAEHFVVAAALGGLLILLLPRAGRRLPGVFAAGLLLGVAVLAKQHAAAFAAFGGLTLVAGGLGGGRDPWRQRGARAAVYAVGVALPFALTCLAMWASGAWRPFWFWTFTYAREYATLNPLATGLVELRRQVLFVTAPAIGLWLLAALGGVAPVFDEAARRPAAYLAALFAFSFAAICPGLRFSEHYFVMLLPVASLLAGLGVVSSARTLGAQRPRLGRALRPALPAAAIALFVWQQGDYLFVRSPIAVSRALYRTNPFPEAAEVAGYLRRHALPGDLVAVIGSEPEIYFSSGVPAATTYIYMYPLMEAQPFARQMQEDMIAQLERANPRFIVLVNVDESWTRKAESSLLIQEWARKTADEAYDTVGVAEIAPGEETDYRWDDAARDPPPRTRLWVQTLERRR